MAAATSFFKTTGTATFPSQATAAQTRLYLGSAASNPTVDLAGDPVISGMLYTNTTNDKLFYYNGSAWVEASPTPAGSMAQLSDDTSPSLGGTFLVMETVLILRTTTKQGLVRATT